MVEYIIIVVLIAITLIVLFTKFGKGIAENLTGATNAISSEVGNEANDEYKRLDTQTIKDFTSEGTFGGN
jgi:Flp pilus assembly pilin Flp